MSNSTKLGDKNGTRDKFPYSGEEEYTYTWDIGVITKLKNYDYIFSPVFRHKEGSECEWTICIYPKGRRQISMNGYISLYLKSTSTENVHRSVTFALSFLDYKEDVIKSQFWKVCYQNHLFCGSDQFISWEFLMSHLKDDTVKIKASFWNINEEMEDIFPSKSSIVSERHTKIDLESASQKSEQINMIQEKDKKKYNSEFAEGAKAEYVENVNENHNEGKNFETAEEANFEDADDVNLCDTKEFKTQCAEDIKTEYAEEEHAEKGMIKIKEKKNIMNADKEIVKVTKEKYLTVMRQEQVHNEARNAKEKITELSTMNKENMNDMKKSENNLHDQNKTTKNGKNANVESISYSDGESNHQHVEKNLNLICKSLSLAQSLTTSSTNDTDELNNEDKSILEAKSATIHASKTLFV